MISVDQHWKQLAEFARWEIAAGGPDPHMKLAGHMSKDCSWEERIWRAGCYVGVYNVPSAEAIWREWPWSRALELDAFRQMAKWLEDNWEGIELRRERKKPLNNSPGKLTKFLTDYAHWADILRRYQIVQVRSRQPEAAYEYLWEQSRANVKYLGRYACFKLLEYLSRYADLPIRLPDIRPVGGDFPRRTLDVLFPEYNGGLAKGNDAETLRSVNEAVDRGIERLRETEDLDLDYYTFEVMLCDYRQSWEGKRQYPGRSQDSEIDYHRGIVEHWNKDVWKTEMFKARAEIFPHWALGEIQGWSGVRKDLCRVLREYGYTWSDKRFDFLATRDFSNPVLR